MSEPSALKASHQQWNDALPKLQQWTQELSERAEGHRKAAHGLRWINRILGFLNIVFAAITATAIYAALNRKLDGLRPAQQIALTCLAVLPAIASGLRKEWEVVEREQGHTSLARDCRILQKQLDFIIEFEPENFHTAIKDWYQRYEEVITRPAVLARK